MSCPPQLSQQDPQNSISVSERRASLWPLGVAGTAPTPCRSHSGPEMGFPAGSHQLGQTQLVLESSEVSPLGKKGCPRPPLLAVPWQSWHLTRRWELAPPWWAAELGYRSSVQSWGWPRQFGVAEFLGCGLWLVGPPGDSGQRPSGHSSLPT